MLKYCCTKVVRSYSTGRTRRRLSLEAMQFLPRSKAARLIVAHVVFQSKNDHKNLRRVLMQKCARALPLLLLEGRGQWIGPAFVSL